MGGATLFSRLRSVLRHPAVRAVLLLPLALGLLYVAFRGVDLQSIWLAVGDANWWWVALAMVVGLLSHMARAARWNVLLETLGRRVALRETFYAVMVGYFSNLLFPRAGEVVRCAQISRAQGVRFDSAVGTVIVERISDVLVFFLLTLVALIVSLRRFAPFLWDRVVHPFLQAFSFSDMRMPAYITIGLLLAGGVFYILLRRNVFGRRLRVRLRRIRRGLVDGMRTILTMPQKGRFLLLTLLMWGCYWLMTYLICFALPVTAHLGLVSSLILLVVGTFGMLIPVQGGFGSFHIAIALWLQVEGLTYAQGLAYATLSHSAQTANLLIIPAILFLIRSVRLYLLPRESNPPCNG